jgi:hypothetical protein
MLLLSCRKLFCISACHLVSEGGKRSRQFRAADGRLGFVSVGNISVVAGIALCTATLVGGSGYLIRELHRQVGVASSLVGVPNPIPEPSPSIEITAEMLHVTSISLGRVPLAVVNGTAITEGESLQVQAANGTATLWATNIIDGTVRFKYGAQTIAANLREASPGKGIGK